jgi:hypothetical protein
MLSSGFPCGYYSKPSVRSVKDILTCAERRKRDSRGNERWTRHQHESTIMDIRESEVDEDSARRASAFKGNQADCNEVLPSSTRTRGSHWRLGSYDMRKVVPFEINEMEGIGHFDDASHIRRVDVIEQDLSDGTNARIFAVSPLHITRCR